MDYFKEFFKKNEDLIEDKLNQFECKLAEMYKPEGKELITRDEQRSISEFRSEH